MKIEETDWARTFEKESPISYREALRLAQDDDLRVDIYRTNETGPWIWVICVRNPVQSEGFWLAGFKKKKEAADLCKQMGWKQ